MQKSLFFLAFMVAIGLSTGLYSVIFRKAIDLFLVSIPWQLAGFLYLGGSLWLLFVGWESRGS